MAEISDEAYDELRLIIEKQYSQSFAIGEVKEVGDGLINFYELIVQPSLED